MSFLCPRSKVGWGFVESRGFPKLEGGRLYLGGGPANLLSSHHQQQLAGPHNHSVTGRPLAGFQKKKWLAGFSKSEWPPLWGSVKKIVWAGRANCMGSAGGWVFESWLVGRVGFVCVVFRLKKDGESAPFWGGYSSNCFMHLTTPLLVSSTSRGENGMTSHPSFDPLWKINWPNWGI